MDRGFSRCLILTLPVILLACGGGEGSGGEGVTPSANARLSSLHISAGGISPTFQPGVGAYTSVQNYEVGNIAVTAIAEDPAATITIQNVPVASGVASALIALALGETLVQVVVRAADATTTRTYTINITRQGSNRLSDLRLSVGGLDQIFQPGQTEYTSSQGFLASSLRVTPVAESEGAVIKVAGVPLGSEESSQALTLEEGPNLIEVVVSATGGAGDRHYMLTVTRQTAASFAQQAYVKASNSRAGLRFGEAVAISGDTIAVGAREDWSGAVGVNGDEDDFSAERSGAVYVFTRNNGIWVQEAYIKASNTNAEDFFGASVALDGDTLAIGATGEASAAGGIDRDQHDNSAPSSGAVYVFIRQDGLWSQQAYVKASNADAGDNFGHRVALSGDTLAVGSPFEASRATRIDGDQDDNTAPHSGAVYVFTHNGNVWSQQAYVKASNSETADRFGWSVALDGDLMLVGAPNEASSASGINGDEADNSALGSGAAYLYARRGGEWEQQAYIKASNSESSDVFGSSVALVNNIIAIGAPLESSSAVGIDGDQSNNDAPRSGAVYVFALDDTGPSQTAYIKPSHASDDAQFGGSVGISGDTLVVGARQESSTATGINGNQTSLTLRYSGAVYVFLSEDGAWAQRFYVKPSTSNVLDRFGGSIAISGDTLVSGAQFERSGARGVNGDENNWDAPSSGAVYVFR